MAGEFNRFQKNAKSALQALNNPIYEAEAIEQDIRPANMQALRQAIADPRHQGKMQQQVLGDELKRIQGIQSHQIQQAARMLPQKLEQELTPAKTGEPWPSPEAMIVRMMLQMQRRYPGMSRGPSPQVPF